MAGRHILAAFVALLFATALPAEAQAAFGYLDQLGSAGTADGQFQDPAGVGAANGELVVADRLNTRVQRFNPDTKAFLGTFGTTGGPADVTFDPASGSPNNVLTVDFTGNLVRRFTSTGTPTGTPATFAAPGPDGIVVGSTGTIFVSNTTNDRIDRYSSSGTLLGSWGGAGSGAGQFNDPSRLALDGSGDLLVADKGNNRIQKLNGTTGAHMLTIGSGQLSQPEGVAVDLSGNIVVADTGNDRIRRYQSSGAAIDTYGATGSGPGQFSSPSDVFAFLNGKVYVADELNNRIQILGEGGTPPSVAPTVVTGEAADITQSAARLTGTVNPKGTSTASRFQYGTTTSYGSTTTAADAGAGSADVAASATISGLAARTTYHYRLVALRSGSVVATGADKTFTTGTDPGGATGCARVGHTIGVVAVCADTITSTGTGTWRASGNVTLNAGVVVGGALDLDDGQQLITSGPGTSIGVSRGSVVNWGTGRLQIDTRAATDPVSGRGNLATVTVFDFTRIVQTTVGGLTMGFLGTSNEYLDAADGGGLILSVKPNFDLGAFINVQPVGSFSLGIHATPSSEFRLLGGSLGWNGINLPGGWKIGLLKLEYQGATSSWAFTGGAEITGVGGLEITGGIVGSQLDQLGLKIKTPGVPLGQTGIVLDTFGGSLKGLSGGNNNPLIISALTGGGWTPTGAPDPFNWILHIKDVTLTINTSGSGTLSGGIAVLDGEGRLAGGTMSLTIAILPFQASGTMNVKLNAVALSLQFNAQAAMNRSHFTGSGSVSGKLVGYTVGSASGIISDVGAGASTRICFFRCWSVGYGLRWANVSSFPPDIDWIGGNTEQYRTISATAAATTAAAERRFTVGRGRPLLYVTARSGDAKTKFELVGPTGVTYRIGGTRRDLYTEVRDGGKVSAVVVLEPKPGTWRLRAVDAPKARVKVQEVAELGRLRARTLRPAGTAKAPLRRTKVKGVLATWRSTRLPRGTKVDVYVSSTRKGQGTLVKRGLRSTGRYRIPMKALRTRTNWVSVVARAEGISFQRVTFRRPVYVK